VPIGVGTPRRLTARILSDERGDPNIDKDKKVLIAGTGTPIVVPAGTLSPAGSDR
jgi:hypothetical protein